MGVAAMQDALANLVSQALGVPAQLGTPMTAPPGLAAFVGLGWRSDPHPMDSSGSNETRTITLHVTLTYVAAIPAGAPPTALRDGLDAAIESVEGALCADRRLGGAAAFAEVSHVEVTDPATDEGGTYYAQAAIDVQVTEYGH
jgi:hypothetical protein